MADNTGMQPRPDSRSLRIPISWDVKKQDKKNWGMTITLAVIILIVLFLLSVGVLFSDRSIFTKILLIGIPMTAYLFIYRFWVFKEGWVRNQYETQKLNDYAIDYSDWWNIYTIDETEPHITHFKNGNKGVFLKLKKDVIQGKQASVEFDHYQAISDVENYIANQKLRFMYIDYMDNVGNDERMARLMSNPNIGASQQLDNMLLSIYSNLELIMQREFSSFDVVFIYEKTSTTELYTKIGGIIEGYKAANYKSVAPMRQDEIRVLAKELFNLDNFSIVEATQAVTGNKTLEIVRPIQVVDQNGTIHKIKPTFEEEKLAKEEALRKRKEGKPKRKPKVSQVNLNNRQDNFGHKEELLDIFQSQEDLGFDTDDLDSQYQDNHTSIIDFEEDLSNTYEDNLYKEELLTRQVPHTQYFTSDIFDDNSEPTNTEPTNTEPNTNITEPNTKQDHLDTVRGIIDIFDPDSTQPNTTGGTQGTDLDIFDDNSEHSTNHDLDIF